MVRKTLRELLNTVYSYYVIDDFTDLLSASATHESNVYKPLDDGYREIVVFAKNAGASSVTIKVQQSPDGTTWIDTPDQNGSTSVSVTDVGYSKWDVVMPFVKAVEVNADGTNAQTDNLFYSIAI